MTNCSANPRNLVRGNTYSNTTATDNNPAIHAAGKNFFRNGYCKVGIVASLITIGTAINQLNDARRVRLCDRPLEWKSCVIASDGNSNWMLI
jgi:hypothetical protein